MFAAQPLDAAMDEDCEEMAAFLRLELGLPEPESEESSSYESNEYIEEDIEEEDIEEEEEEDVEEEEGEGGNAVQ